MERDERAFAMRRKCVDCGSLPGEVCITTGGRDYDKLHVYRKSISFDEAGNPVDVDRVDAFGNPWRREREPVTPLMTPRQQAYARALANRELSPDQERLLSTLTFTVIGVWQDDKPIPVGVIKGDHDVRGGDESHFDGGVWATSVEASSVRQAEAEAVARMLGE